MNIGVLGCSHSGYGYGYPWHYYLKNDLNCEISDFSSSGVGNEMMIEKIKTVLSKNSNYHNYDVDFFIFQITDPSRLVLGLYGNDVKKEYAEKFGNLNHQKNLCCHREINNVSYHTFRFTSGDDEINYLVNGNYEITEFLRKHVLISDFNMKIKIFHTLMCIQNLVNFFNKKILFFSWNVDIIELSKEVGYYDIVKEMSIINGNVENFATKRGLKKVDNIHYGSDEHKVIYDEFLKNKIFDFIKNDIK